MSTFVANTPLAHMIALGAEGERSHGRTTALVTRHLSAEHAAILADPVPLRDGSGVDWYVDEDSEVTPLADLPPAEADALRRALATLLSDIRAKADQMESEPGNLQAAASALRHATQFPGEDCIYALRSGEGVRPVVVAWGYNSHDPDAARPFNVSTFAARPEAAGQASSPRPGLPTFRATVDSGAGTTALPPPRGPGAEDDAADPAPAASRRPVAWGRAALATLLSLLTLLLFALVVAFLLPACGLRTPFGTLLFGLPSQVAGCAAAPVDDARAQAEALERELAILRQQLVDRQSACPPPAAPEPPPAPPASPPAKQDTFEQRVNRRGITQVTLIWDTVDDIDLSIRCPGGEEISFSQKSNCGGELDIDKNSGGGYAVTTPVENITFPNGLIKNGKYQIFVRLFNKRSSQKSIPFRVRIREGDNVREVSGQLSQPKQVIDIGEITRP